jgi:hypothetical protein
MEGVNNVNDPANLPTRFAQLKRDIAASIGPDFEANAIKSWAEIIDELNRITKDIAEKGSDVSTPILFYFLSMSPPLRCQLLED